jgi:hypothetical protein
VKTLTTLALAFCLGTLTSSDATEVSFETLSDFEYKEGMELPSEVTKYDGETVEVSGFMRREDSGEGEVEYFMLISDICGCEGTPKLNEIIFCAMPDGETTKIHSSIVTVTGTLWVGEREEDGIVVSIYDMDVDSID